MEGARQPAARADANPPAACRRTIGFQIRRGHDPRVMIAPQCSEEHAPALVDARFDAELSADPYPFSVAGPTWRPLGAVVGRSSPAPSRRGWRWERDATMTRILPDVRRTSRGNGSVFVASGLKNPVVARVATFRPARAPKVVMGNSPPLGGRHRVMRRRLESCHRHSASLKQASHQSLQRSGRKRGPGVPCPSRWPTSCAWNESDTHFRRTPMSNLASLCSWRTARCDAPRAGRCRCEPETCSWFLPAR